MKNTAHFLTAGLILFAATAPLIAAEATDKPTYNASVELGLVKTSGNSDTETVNAKAKGSTSYTDWKHTLKLEALNTSSNDERSAEKYFAVAQSDRSLSDRSYLFGVLSWEKDRFSGFDYEASAALGYGYKLINQNNMELDLEVAPGYRVSEFRVGDKEEDAILRLAETFTWDVSETSTLEQSLTSESGESNTITRFGIALTSQVAGQLSMKLGYNLKHSSDVPTNADKTDTESSVTLVYKI